MAAGHNGTSKQANKQTQTSEFESFRVCVCVCPFRLVHNDGNCLQKRNGACSHLIISKKNKKRGNESRNVFSLNQNINKLGHAHTQSGRDKKRKRVSQSVSAAASAIDLVAFVGSLSTNRCPHDQQQQRLPGE